MSTLCNLHNVIFGNNLSQKMWNYLMYLTFQRCKFAIFNDLFHSKSVWHSRLESHKQTEIFGAKRLTLEKTSECNSWAISRFFSEIVFWRQMFTLVWVKVLWWLKLCCYFKILNLSSLKIIPQADRYQLSVIKRLVLGRVR
jgi:hypothetical protein